eukprot:734208_1
MCSLSLDIETFYEQTRSSTASIKAAEQILYCIRKCVYELQDKCKKEFNDFDPNLRIRNAKYLCFEHIFQSIRHPYFWWNVFKFGSQALDTSYGSDLDHDIAITANFNSTREDNIYLLTELTQILSQNVESLCITSLLHAKYPIIQAQCKTSMIKFDISIADAFCEHTQQIMQNYIQYFEQNGVAIKPFIVFVKYWAKQNGINDGYHRFLNSFGYTILVIKFLQIFCAHYGYGGHSLSTLLFGFYYLYAVEFNPTKHAISIITNSSAFDLKMNQKCWMEIVDPANKNNNVAQNVGPQRWLEIRQVFIKAHDIYKHSQVHYDPRQSLFCLLTNSKQEYHNGVNGHNHMCSTSVMRPSNVPYQLHSNVQNDINYHVSSPIVHNTKHHAPNAVHINKSKKARRSPKKNSKQKKRQNKKKKKKKKEPPSVRSGANDDDDDDDQTEFEPLPRIENFPEGIAKRRYRSKCHNIDKSGTIIIETQAQKKEYRMHLADEIDALCTHSITTQKVQEQRLYEYIITCVRHLQRKLHKKCNPTLKRCINTKTPWNVHLVGPGPVGEWMALHMTVVIVLAEGRKKWPVRGNVQIMNTFESVLRTNRDPSLTIEQTTGDRTMIKVHQSTSNTAIEIYVVSNADQYLKRDEYVNHHITKFKQYPVDKLSVFVRYWAKMRGLSFCTESYFEALGWNVLVIKFMEKRKNSIKTDDDMSIIDLLCEFFRFYGTKHLQSLDFLSFMIKTLPTKSAQATASKDPEYLLWATKAIRRIKWKCRLKKNKEKIAEKYKKACGNTEIEFKQWMDIEKPDIKAPVALFMELTDPINKSVYITNEITFIKYKQIEKELKRAFDIIRMFGSSDHWNIRCETKCLFALLLSDQTPTKTCVKPYVKPIHRNHRYRKVWTTPEIVKLSITKQRLLRKMNKRVSRLQRQLCREARSRYAKKCMEIASKVKPYPRFYICANRINPILKNLLFSTGNGMSKSLNWQQTRVMNIIGCTTRDMHTMNDYKLRYYWSILVDCWHGKYRQYGRKQILLLLFVSLFAQDRENGSNGNVIMQRKSKEMKRICISKEKGIYPSVPINYVCFECKARGQHWIMHCPVKVHANIL